MDGCGDEWMKERKNEWIIEREWIGHGRIQQMKDFKAEDTDHQEKKTIIFLLFQSPIFFLIKL